MLLCACFTDEFVSSRQRRFYNNSATGVQPPKGNALEIARNFRLQKQKTTSKVSTASKVIVKSTVTDNSIVKPGTSPMHTVSNICVHVYD